MGRNKDKLFLTFMRRLEIQATSLFHRAERGGIRDISVE